jgi:addiction module HigA family antidote
VLREEWLIPLDINANQLAGTLGVDRQKVYDVVNAKRRVSAEMA